MALVGQVDRAVLVEKLRQVVQDSQEVLMDLEAQMDQVDHKGQVDLVVLRVHYLLVDQEDLEDLVDQMVLEDQMGQHLLGAQVNLVALMALVGQEVQEDQVD